MPSDDVIRDDDVTRALEVAAADAASESWDDDATEVVESFSPGSFFADVYRIEKLLGGGAGGQVYEATDLTRGHVVALKVLRGARGNSEAHARFVREGEILATLDHPGIVRVERLGQSKEGTLFLAMERLHGETLADRLRRLGPLSPAEVVALVQQAATALDAAHGAGIVHRDVKPENLFLAGGATPGVRVLDFGLSSFASAEKLTRPGTAIGTPRYVAPEQIIAIKNAGPRADVYALAVVAYEALTKTSPFGVEDRMQMLGAILQGRAVPLSTRRPDLPRAVSDVLARGMARDARNRFPTATELALRLEDAFEREGEDAHGERVSLAPTRATLPPAEAPRFSATPAIPGAPRSPALPTVLGLPLAWVFALIAVGVVIVGGAALLGWWLARG